ncbi:hypothetical protein LJR230_003510 [Trinickia sp. LjRoot230]|uniref:hypothetical protein n=1 Tax=Trinickia sp. LjRoot230 TaxID=3342288 RepID=UPI003ECCE32B
MSSLIRCCFATATAATLLLTSLTLVACSPAYDWRTVSDNANGYEIDLPAKPMIDERAIDIAGMTMPMEVRAAHTEGAVFAIGAIVLPADDPQLQQRVLDALRAGLARNVGAAADADARPAQVSLAGGGKVPALELVLSGVAGAQRERKTIHAWLVARGRHVYQATIVADEAPREEQTDQFFRSFKLF